jgi:hypothetical protein
MSLTFRELEILTKNMIQDDYWCTLKVFPIRITP